MQAAELFPWALPQVCFIVIRNVFLFALLDVTEMFHCAETLRLDNRKIFPFSGCKISNLFFFMNKYDSSLLKR